MRFNTDLRELTLFNNNIGDAGAAALANGLRSNTALNELQLHRTQISNGSKGFTCISKATGKHAFRAGWELGVSTSIPGEALERPSLTLMSGYCLAVASRGFMRVV